MAHVNTLQFVSASVAAYRHNGNKVYRELTDQIQHTNKTLILSLMGEATPALLSITDDDKAHAKVIIDDILQRHTMSLLTGKKMPDFTMQVLNCIKEETTSPRLIGYITWVPSLFDKLQAADAKDHQLSVHTYSSKYLGKLKDKIELDFVAIEERFSTQYNCWRYTGHDTKGNLIGFFRKEKLSGTGMPIRIKGNVKAHETSKSTKGNTTYLNYVKELK